MALGPPGSFALAFVLAARLGSACAGTSPAPPPSTPAAAPAADPAALHYTVWLDERLDAMTLRLCFEGPAPARLATRRDAGDHVRWARRASDGAPLRVTADAIHTDAVPADGCVECGIALDRLVRRASRTQGAAIGADVLASPDLWLWHPAPLDPRTHATLRLILPAGVTAAVPWPRGEDGSYALAPLAFRWRAHVAFGRFDPLELEVAGARFRVAILDHEHAATTAGIERWLRTAGETVASLYGGRFPVEQVSIVVAPIPSWGRAPVLFGHATRGGGAAILLLLDADARDDQLPGEWVAIHEMLHLGMPYVRPIDAWLSEGFVTYYTQVLRARAGLLPGGGEPASGADAQAMLALRNMSDGFARARRSASTRTLADASRSMHASGAYARVYWGGAAVALACDVAIRVASGGRRSLDDAMRGIQSDCSSGEVWSAARVLARMDGALAAGPDGSPIRDLVQGTARRHLETRGMVDLQEEFARLGVEVGAEAGGAPRFADDGRATPHLRHAIFGPDPFAGQLVQ